MPGNRLRGWLLEPWFVPFALVNGAAFAAAMTVANLLIVERRAKAECNQWLGWLETVLSVGQGGALVLAAWLSGLSPRAGPLIGALLPAAVLAGGLAARMVLLAALAALAAVGHVGSVAGGGAASLWGYPAALAIGACAVTVGLAVFLRSVLSAEPKGAEREG
jgi:hypothetical protein